MIRNFDIFEAILRPLVMLGIASVVLVVVLWVLSLTLFPRELPAAVLHYNVGVGIDFIGEGRQILVLPGIGTAILILDAGLAYVLRKTSYLAGAILMGAGLLSQVLLIAAFISILIMNR